MKGIIKRDKTINFAQIENAPLQTLNDIRTVGLLAYLMSLPPDWSIRKMNLYDKFGKATVIKGIGELEEKKYWVTIQYRKGNRNVTCHYASDGPFTDQEVSELIADGAGERLPAKAISVPFCHLIASASRKPSIDRNEQLKEKDSPSSVQKVQLLNKEDKTNKKQIHFRQRQIVNSQPFCFEQLLKAACDSHYAEFAPGRWDKQSWNILIDQFIAETMEAGRDKKVEPSRIAAYAYASIKNMAQHHDYANVRKPEAHFTLSKEIPLYNWLE